jgi:co-chaperonin GroES (HSP10)
MARSNAIGKMREIAESSDDPRTALLNAIGKKTLREFTVLHSQVLIATYVRAAKTAGGIFMPDKVIEEDRWQGNIGLVIALGKGAFKDDGVAQFHGDTLEIGDWVMYVPADGVSLFIRQVPCRLFQDSRILMKVTNPEIYY